MIVDHRTYTVKPGSIGQFLALYKKAGLPLQKKHLGHCVGWYISMDIGELNQVVHMWAYKDLNDRAARRAELMKEQGWLDYLAEAMPLLQTMENKIVTAADWFDLDAAVSSQD
ncbi:hypothetical protein AB833_08560 [Chromatiales bacterium (ex Bugula neritina AB1)]|nr:hypothetical protein AB833_08560 [Chromatiales bacterium (ex Bugula neritina AB1)]